MKTFRHRHYGVLELQRVKIVKIACFFVYSFFLQHFGIIYILASANEEKFVQCS